MEMSRNRGSSGEGIWIIKLKSGDYCAWTWLRVFGFGFRGRCQSDCQANKLAPGVN